MSSCPNKKSSVVKMDLNTVSEILERFADDLDYEAERLKEVERTPYFWLKEAVKHLNKTIEALKKATNNMMCSHNCSNCLKFHECWNRVANLVDT